MCIANVQVWVFAYNLASQWCVYVFVLVRVHTLAQFQTREEGREMRLILDLLCKEFSNSLCSLFKRFQDCLEVK